MADSNKPQLSDEEKMLRKAKMFRIISRILIGLSVIIIGVFIYFAMGTRQNIQEQTSIDTGALRSKLKQIISLERRYYEENGEYAGFKYLQLIKEIPQYLPDLDGSYKYMFDAETGIATGVEKDATNDVNGDIDGNDGLTLDVNWNADVVKGQNGGNFFWPEADLQDFARRRAENGIPEPKK